jgi:hypothetical protein
MWFSGVFAVGEISVFVGSFAHSGGLGLFAMKEESFLKKDAS